MQYLVDVKQYSLRTLSRYGAVATGWAPGTSIETVYVQAGNKGVHSVYVVFSVFCLSRSENQPEKIEYKPPLHYPYYGHHDH